MSTNPWGFRKEECPFSTDVKEKEKEKTLMTRGGMRKLKNMEGKSMQNKEEHVHNGIL